MEKSNWHFFTLFIVFGPIQLILSYWLPRTSVHFLLTEAMNYMAR
jgi:hypothetical protein